MITGERETVSIVFSSPISVSSCTDSISFIPSKNGSWQIIGTTDGTSSDANAVFTPEEPWEQGTKYKLTVAAAFTNIYGLRIGKEQASRFSIGLDTIPPEVTRVYAVDKDGNKTPLDADELGKKRENLGWEKDTRLQIDFSEPVDCASVKNHIVVEPSSSLIMETYPGLSDSVVFAFSERPKFESRFLFRINAGIKDAIGNQSTAAHLYRIYADGPHSKPPALAGLRLPKTPAASSDPMQVFTNTETDFFTNIEFFKDEIVNAPYTKDTPFFFELYFDIAEDADIDLFSLMDKFSVSASNNALSFSPHAVVDKDFTAADPAAGWESYHRVEVRGVLINEVNSGVITFQIRTGLLDTLGNKAEAARLPLLK
jgi:hypothetical protein